MSIGRAEDAISEAVRIYVESAHCYDSDEYRDRLVQRIYAVTVTAFHAAIRLEEAQ